MSIPKSLIQNVAAGRIVPFVGSGVSMAVKPELFPSWAELLKKLAAQLEDEGSEDSAGIVQRYVKKGQLNKAADEAVDALGKAQFRDVMHRIFGIAQPSDADLSLPNAIWCLEPRVVVTTNYDRVLEWSKPSKTVRNNEVSNLAALFSQTTSEPPAVWHLHGHISDADTIILSPQQYNVLYRDAADDNHPLAAARQQLRNLISTYPLLFVGFGLQDEYVMQALSTVLEIFKGNLQASYALLRKGDSRAAELWKKYSITVVEFDDYGQPLIDVVRQIAEEAKSHAGDVKGSPAYPEPISPTYIAWLTEQCVDITPFGMAPTQGQSVCLQQVYVPPITTVSGFGYDFDSELGFKASHDLSVGFRRQLRYAYSLDQFRHRTVMEVVENCSVYLSGDPGSGKSTFCRWIAWVVATGGIPRFEIPTPQEFQESFPESLRGYLPVLVRLREFREYISSHPGQRTLSTIQFESALEKWLNETHPGGLTWKEVKPHLNAGSLLLILDGVDEVPLSEGASAMVWSPRECVVSGLASAVRDWMKVGNKILVTSRPYGLGLDQVRTLDRAGLAEVRFEKLPKPLQELLAMRWFVALPKTATCGKDIARTMLQEVWQLSGDVEALASNPLLLTAICIIYGEGKQLPKDIHDLYHRIVNTSLQSRFPRDARVIDLVRARLAAVAFGMHTGEPFEPGRTVPVAEVGLVELDAILAKYIGANQETESEFRNQIEAREELLGQSGLLSQSSSDRAGFFHLSFQEFQAAEQIARLNEGPEKLLNFILQRVGILNWRPTLKFLLCRRATIQGTRATVDLLDQMISTVDLNSIARPFGMGLIIVDALTVLLDRKLVLQPSILDRFTKICLSAIEVEVDVKSRVELACMLARIGDPRVANDIHDSGAWVTVESGTYCFRDDEEFHVHRGFEISKFPITQGQFASFLKHGYMDPTHWHPKGWKWRSKNQICGPLNSQLGASVATHPATGISWWEADAFCRWAGIRLPTEREWEAASRGKEGFNWPWGDDSQTEVCNSKELGLNSATPVGIFPRSKSHCGAYDMAGNVWEWCSNHDDTTIDADYFPAQILRGGSWEDTVERCCSLHRSSTFPSVRHVHFGFRAVRDLKH